jgi:hypothetical protein
LLRRHSLVTLLCMTDYRTPWKRLLQEVELARNYHWPYALIGVGRTFRNPIIEAMLPSLLFVRLVSLFDEALTDYLENQTIHWPPKTKQDLNGRIALLDGAGRLLNAASLHVLRKRRNLLAHNGNPKPVTWDELSDALKTIGGELLNLNVIDGVADLQLLQRKIGTPRNQRPRVRLRKGLLILVGGIREARCRRNLD